MMQKLGFKKGFTLIELLVVIGVLAVIAAGVVALIDPVDKNRAAMDAKVQSDIGQIATAMQSYAARDAAGQYPTALGTLSPSELVRVPVPPAGYGATQYTIGGTNPNMYLCGPLRSKKYTATPNWMWEAATGKTCAVAACAANATSACP